MTGIMYAKEYAKKYHAAKCCLKYRVGKHDENVAILHTLHWF